MKSDARAISLKPPSWSGTPWFAFPPGLETLSNSPETNDPRYPVGRVVLVLFIKKWIQDAGMH